MAKTQEAQRDEAREHAAYTVLAPLDMAHCEEGEHEAFDEAGDSLGFTACTHAPGHYGPGQTVHLSEASAEPFVRAGDLAAAGAPNLDELMVRAAARRLGLEVREA